MIIGYTSQHMNIVKRKMSFVTLGRITYCRVSSNDIRAWNWASAYLGMDPATRNIVIHWQCARTSIHDTPDITPATDGKLKPLEKEEVDMTSTMWTLQLIVDVLKTSTGAAYHIGTTVVSGRMMWQSSDVQARLGLGFEKPHAPHIIGPLVCGPEVDWLSAIGES